jgi:hypothetical protein
MLGRKVICIVHPEIGALSLDQLQRKEKNRKVSEREAPRP